jgi:hypothetical protein
MVSSLEGCGVVPKLQNSATEAGWEIGVRKVQAFTGIERVVSKCEEEIDFRYRPEANAEVHGVRHRASCFDEIVAEDRGDAEAAAGRAQIGGQPATEAGSVLWAGRIFAGGSEQDSEAQDCEASHRRAN